MARHRPATLVHPGRHVTWYGDDAQRSRAIALVNALLGNWGREGGFYFPAAFDLAEVLRTRPTRTASAAAVDNPEARYPFADLGLTNGIREATITGDALPDQGLVRLRDEPAAGAAQPGGDDPRHPGARPDGRRRRRAVGDRRLGRRGAARIGLPRALRRLQHRGVPRAVRLAAPAGGRSRPTTRSRTGGSRASWRASSGSGAYYPWTNVEEYLDARLAGGRPHARGAQDEGRGGRAPPADQRRGGPRRSSSRPRRARSSSGRRSSPRRGSTRSRSYTRARRAAAGLLPAALRPRAGAHLLAHPDQPAARRGDARRTRSGSTPTSRARWGSRTAAGAPGRTRTAWSPTAGQGQGDRAHPHRLRLHGARLRAYREGAADAPSAGAPPTPSWSRATRSIR